MRRLCVFKIPLNKNSRSFTNRGVVQQVADPFAPPQIDNVIQEQNLQSEDDSAKYQPYNFNKSNSNSNLHYTQFAIYKGKSALQINVVPPVWTTLRNGSKSISKEGCMMLQFAKSTAPRQYDWNNKVMFAMSVLELGEIIDIPKENDVYQFFHDPNMQSSKQGLTTKSLKIQQDTNKTGFFILVNQSSGGNRTNISVPVSKAEYNIIVNIAKFSIPYLLGFDQVLKS